MNQVKVKRMLRVVGFGGPPRIRKVKLKKSLQHVWWATWNQCNTHVYIGGYGSTPDEALGRMFEHGERYLIFRGFIKLAGGTRRWARQ